jgi:hypothetical protein
MKKANWIPVPVLIILGLSHSLPAVLCGFWAGILFLGGPDPRPGSEAATWGLAFLGIAAVFGTAAFGFIRAAVRKASPGYVTWAANVAAILIVGAVVWLFVRHAI